MADKTNGKPKTRTATKPRNAVKRALQPSQMKEVLHTMSAIAQRANIASRLGKSFDGDRDLYAALGYLHEPKYSDFIALYRRNDVARAVISRPVRPCWRQPPKIVEAGDNQTAFEKKVEELAERLRLWHYFGRVDKLARLGQFALLYIGFNDVDKADRMKEPAAGATDVVYVMPYSEGSCEVKDVIANPKNPLYGRPETYKIEMSDGRGGSQSKLVHYTRVIHVSQDNLENDVYGTPALENPFNRIYDLEKIVGASGEGFYRGAFPGLVTKLDEGATLGKQDLDAMQDEFEKYLHLFQRYIRAQGFTVEQLLPQIADPSGAVDVCMRMIATGMEIPKRILEGSERGELSSSQDERAWLDYIEERRTQHCEPVIVRPFFQRCADVKVLELPAGGYKVDWPDLAAKSDKEMADVAKVKAEATKVYNDSGDGQLVYPVQKFQEDLGMTREEIEAAAKAAEEVLDDANGGPDEGQGDNDDEPE